MAGRPPSHVPLLRPHHGRTPLFFFFGCVLTFTLVLLHAVSVEAVPRTALFINVNGGNNSVVVAEDLARVAYPWGTGYRIELYSDRRLTFFNGNTASSTITNAVLSEPCEVNWIIPCVLYYNGALYNLGTFNPVLVGASWVQNNRFANVSIVPDQLVAGRNTLEMVALSNGVVYNLTASVKIPTDPTFLSSFQGQIVQVGISGAMTRVCVLTRAGLMGCWGFDASSFWQPHQMPSSFANVLSPPYRSMSLGHYFMNMIDQSGNLRSYYSGNQLFWSVDGSNLVKVVDGGMALCYWPSTGAFRCAGYLDGGEVWAGDLNSNGAIKAWQAFPQRNQLQVITCTDMTVCAPSPSPSPSSTQTPTRTPSLSPSNSRLPTPSASPTASVSVTGTPTRSPTQSPTRSATPTVTPSSSGTSTPTRSPTQSSTPTPSSSLSITPSRSSTPSSTRSPTPSISRSPSNSPTPSRTPSNSPSFSPSRSPMPTRPFGRCDLSTLVCGSFVENWSCLISIDSDRERLVFHEEDCSCSIECTSRFTHDSYGRCSVCKPCTNGVVNPDTCACMCPPPFAKDPVTGDCTQCVAEPLPPTSFFVRLPENNCQRTCGWGMTLVGDQCRCVLGARPEGLYIPSSVGNSSWCSWDCPAGELTERLEVLPQWEQLTGAFPLSPDGADLTTWISTTASEPWQSTWSSSAWPWSGRQCDRKCNEGRMKGNTGHCDVCAQPLTNCGTNEEWEPRTCQCACKSGFTRNTEDGTCQPIPCSKSCGPRRVLNPVTCDCECVPYMQGDQCQECRWTPPNLRKAPFIFGPNEAQERTGLHEVLCTYGCKDLWSRDEVTGLCEVCNAKEDSCPRGQKVDYLTCSCVATAVVEEAALAESSTEEATSLIDCGPGEPNQEMTECVCPTGFVGKDCQTLDASRQAPFYHWGPIAYSAPVCWPNDDSVFDPYQDKNARFFVPTVPNTWSLKAPGYQVSDAEMLNSKQWVKLVSAGNSTHCGLTRSEEMYCWTIDIGPGTTQVLRYVQGVIDVAAGGGQACYVRRSRKAECFDFAKLRLSYSFNSVDAIDVTDGGACVVTYPDRQIECQGTDISWTPFQEDLRRSYHSMSCASFYCCSLIYSGPEAGGIRCWGFAWGNANRLPKDDEHFIQVSASDQRLCAIQSTLAGGTQVKCWNRPSAEMFQDQTATLLDLNSDWPLLKISVTDSAITTLQSDPATLRTTVFMYQWMAPDLNDPGITTTRTFKILGPTHFESWIDVSAASSTTCGLMSKCGSAAASGVGGCYCPIFKRGTYCEAPDCDRYWMLNQVFPEFTYADWTRYCAAESFDPELCMYHQYTLDNQLRLLQQEMAEFPNTLDADFDPRYCPREDTILFGDWASAWEECTGTPVAKYCDTVLLTPSAVRDLIVPLNRHDATVYQWSPRDIINSEYYRWDNTKDDTMRWYWSAVFDGTREGLLQNLEMRVGTDLPVYRCLVETLDSFLWEPEQFAMGCARRATWEEASSFGAPNRVAFLIDQVQAFYGDTFNVPCEWYLIQLLPSTFTAGSVLQWDAANVDLRVDQYWYVRTDLSKSTDIVSAEYTVASGEGVYGVKLTTVGFPPEPLWRLCDFQLDQNDPKHVQVRCYGADEPYTAYVLYAETLLDESGNRIGNRVRWRTDDGTYVADDNAWWSIASTMDLLPSQC